MSTLTTAVAAALVATAPAFDGYFTQNGRHFVSEHDVGGGMGESFVEGSVTDLWTGRTENLEPMQRIANCSVTCEGQPSGCTADCESDNRASERSFDAAMKRWHKVAARTPRSLSSHSGEARFEVLAAPGDPPVRQDPANPLSVDGAKGSYFLLRLSVPGRPVRTFKDRFHFGEDRRLTLFLIWSPDDQWVGYTRPGDLHPRAYPAIARVDVLDSGAGPRLAAVLEKLEKAGYKASHQGKAKTARKTSEVFVLPGFEEDGRLVAKALGLADDAVKPLTWPSAYAVTVAAGSE